MRLPVLLATVAVTAICSRADVWSSSIGPDFRIAADSALAATDAPQKQVKTPPMPQYSPVLPEPAPKPEWEEKRPIEYLPPWLAEAILDQVDVFDQNSMAFAAEALLTLLVGAVGVRGVRRHRRTVRRRRAVA